MNYNYNIWYLLFKILVNNKIQNILLLKQCWMMTMVKQLLMKKYLYRHWLIRAERNFMRVYFRKYLTCLMICFKIILLE
jgi:hypothetical protein